MIKLFALFVLFSSSIFAFHSYQFTKQHLDVIIPCCEKDLVSLNLCIDHLKKSVKNIHRIIVISAKKITDKAEWFPEQCYPFDKYDIALEIFQNSQKASGYLKCKNNRIGWLYQQLLKLYACYVIPNISENIFVLDADIFLLRPITLINPETNAALFNVGSEHWSPYFAHAKRLIPGFRKVFPKHSGITHHMLMQKTVLDHLFNIVESYHGIPFWKAFCRCIDLKYLSTSSASEYEIYFNFAFMTSDQFTLRPLKWIDIARLNQIQDYENSQYAYIAFHSYCRSP